MKEYEKRECCASCDSKNLKTILDLDQVPLAGFFPKKEELSTVSSYSLELQICEDCKLVQTDSVIDPDVLFRDYRYLSSIGLTNHFEGVAKDLHEKYNIIDKDILEFGCNDGVLLQPLTDIGANAIGVDPSINVSQIARDKGLNVITDYFNYDTFGTNKWEDKFDFILANNAFAHIIDIKNTTKAVQHCLKDGGKFIFEVHYLKNLIDELQWDNIYHEHIYYYSITALNNMLSNYGMNIVDVEEISIHSGSIRVTAEKGAVSTSDKVKEIIENESKTICDIKYLKTFNKNVQQHIEDFGVAIKELVDAGVRVAGYGASGRANMFCNITNLDSDIIEFVDVETLKNATDIDLLIIFAWNYSKMIVEKTQFRDFDYMIAFPSVNIFTTEGIKELNLNSI